MSTDGAYARTAGKGRRTSTWYVDKCLHRRPWRSDTKKTPGSSRGFVRGDRRNGYQVTSTRCVLGCRTLGSSIKFPVVTRASTNSCSPAVSTYVPALTSIAGEPFGSSMSDSSHWRQTVYCLRNGCSLSRALLTARFLGSGITATRNFEPSVPTQE